MVHQVQVEVAMVHQVQVEVPMALQVQVPMVLQVETEVKTLYLQSLYHQFLLLNHHHHRLHRLHRLLLLLHNHLLLLLLYTPSTMFKIRSFSKQGFETSKMVEAGVMDTRFHLFMGSEIFV